MPLAPYGSWESPITALAVTRAALSFSDSLEVDGADLYCTESRPAEAGRTVVVHRAADGAITDVRQVSGFAPAGSIAPVAIDGP